MVRRSPRLRRQLPLRGERLLRVTGWRYSMQRDAWVHRAFGGRYGPVFVLGPDIDVPELAEPGAPFPVMLPDEHVAPMLTAMPPVTKVVAAPSAVAAIYPEDPWAGMRVDGAPPSVSEILAGRLGSQHVPTSITAAITPTVAKALPRRDRRHRAAGDA